MGLKIAKNFTHPASEPNAIHSFAVAEKLINISTPAILWSFDTI